MRAAFKVDVTFRDGSVTTYPAKDSDAADRVWNRFMHVTPDPRKPHTLVKNVLIRRV